MLPTIMSKGLVPGFLEDPSMQRFVYCFITLLLLTTGGKCCFAEYGPPAVLNCSRNIIAITIARADGKIVTAAINPSAALLQPVADSRVMAIGTHSSNELMKLRRQRGVGRELWIVLPDGIELVEFGELRSRRSQCK